MPNRKCKLCKKDCGQGEWKGLKGLLRKEIIELCLRGRITNKKIGER